MVKNISGGSKSKKMASKTFHTKRILRLSSNDEEIYAIITEKLGGGHLRAIGIDGILYMVHIGGKFKSERYNKYDFILIGLRDWQTSNTFSKKNIMTDLLEVYNECEKIKLLKLQNFNWDNLLQHDLSNSQELINNSNDVINFINDTEQEYKEIIEKQINYTLKCDNKYQENFIDEDINIADI